MAGIRQKRWDEGENVMKERKKSMGWQNDTEKLKRGYQLAVTRLRPVRPHTVTKLKELEPRLPVLQRKTHTRTHPVALQRNRGRKTKQVLEKREEGANMLVEYVKNIGLYYGL
jgi:hypothetical protein